MSTLKTDNIESLDTGRVIEVDSLSDRQDLANDASGSGASLVSMEGGPSVEVAVLDRVIRATSIEEMLAVTVAESRQVSVQGYHSDSSYGGGIFYWDEDFNKTRHDGGTIIDPTRPYPSDWENQTQLANWFSTGSGSGCWVRIYSDTVNISFFGTKSDGVYDNSLIFNHVTSNFESLQLGFGTYVLKSEISLVEPFDLECNDSYIRVEHEGTGFKIESSTYANKINISSSTNINFLSTTETPDHYIDIGVASVLEPTNIFISGMHFKNTESTISHVRNQRVYGLKIVNSAFNEITGTCIHYANGIGADESKYSYNMYVDKVDITGADYGIIIDGGKLQVRDSIFESCRSIGVWSKGLGFNPSIYMDNVYFENNAVTLRYEEQEDQGYPRNADVNNCFFNSNARTCFFDFGTNVRISNCKGFSLNSTTGRGTVKLANTQSGVSYDPNLCEHIRISIEGPIEKALGVIEDGERVKVPYFNLNATDSGAGALGLRLKLIRNTSTRTTYFECIIQALEAEAGDLIYRVIPVQDISSGGITAAPSFETSTTDPSDMNLYFYFAEDGFTSYVVEGSGGAS